MPGRCSMIRMLLKCRSGLRRLHFLSATRSHQTGKEKEELASRVMKGHKDAEDTKELAATVLSQANRQR